MRRAAPLIAAAMAAVLVAGCAAVTAPSSSLSGQAGVDRITAEAIAEEVTRGGRTRGEVTRRLGEPRVVRFDSGYEVWVYRVAEAAAARQRGGGANRPETREGTGELVILVAPSGEVIKARTRSAPAPGRPAG